MSKSDDDDDDDDTRPQKWVTLDPCVLSFLKKNNYVVGNFIAKGSYKKVYELCINNKTPCDDVLLHVKSGMLENILDAKKEMQIIKRVYDFAIQNGRRPIVLPIKAYHECIEKSPFSAYIIQSRAYDDMQNLGFRQWTKTTPRPYPSPDILLFTRAQLIDAFRVAGELYRTYKITHGDLKPDNMLYKDGRFYVSDFGFSGALRGPMSKEVGLPKMGFSQYIDTKTSDKLKSARPGFSRNFGCPTKFEISPEIRPYHNIWQLELLLRASYITVIDMTDYSSTAGGVVNRYRIFESVDDLEEPDILIPIVARANLDGACNGLLTAINKRNFSAMKTREFIKSWDGPIFSPKPSVMFTDVMRELTTFILQNRYDSLPSWLKQLISSGVQNLSAQNKYADIYHFQRTAPPPLQSSSSSSSSAVNPSSSISLSSNVVDLTRLADMSLAAAPTPPPPPPPPLPLPLVPLPPPPLRASAQTQIISPVASLKMTLNGGTVRKIAGKTLRPTIRNNPINNHQHYHPLF